MMVTSIHSRLTSRRYAHPGYAKLNLKWACYFVSILYLNKIYTLYICRRSSRANSKK